MATKKAAAKVAGSGRKRKAIKFRQVSFKLTEYQKKALDRYCKSNKMTPVRFMKALINGHVERYREQAPPQSYVTDNQLELFEVDDNKLYARKE
jgi:hypothetical protein